MSPDPSALLSRLPPGLRREFVPYRLDVVVTPLQSLANRVVRVTTPRADLVLRISAPRDPVDVVAERAALHRAAALGLGPGTVWLAADGALLVTRTIGGRPMAARDFRNASIAAAAGAALRRFHDSKVVLPAEDLRQLIMRLEREAGAIHAGPVVSGHLRAAVSKAAEERGEGVPSHGDPHASNWLRSDTELRLVDWEYARLHEPAWDLATVALQIGTGEPAIEALLEGYGAGADVRKRLWPAALLVLAVDGFWSLARLRDVARSRWRLEQAEALARRLA